MVSNNVSKDALEVMDNLSKDYFASYSISSWSGLLNRYELDWDSQLLDYLGIKPKNLPQLKSYKNHQMGLNKIYSERWPLLLKAKFFINSRFCI
jgi:glycerol kinase